ncbi:MAG: A/G-specific adenine glycosylase [Beijerinckiaceae bacterium]|nr:A/G-specific adenine glycosylase [Beijerinckiaceae bacterium]
MIDAETAKSPAAPNERPSHADELLSWYDRHRRKLPWRALPGKRADPYAVWLSEIMLQQTTVAAVKPYYETFLALWPTVGDLATAPIEDVMKAWAGLGYYSRARNLHLCARTVVERFGGRFPHDYENLLSLPGVGAYTAAAIASIAFETRAVVVDGNVERVVARLFAIETEMPAARPEIRRLADTLTPEARPGDYAQAMMDLGATICTPRKPACALCPVNAGCRAFAAGEPERYPRKAAKAARPSRRGAAFVAMRDDGAVLVEQRPPKGLLGGMVGLPTTDWSTKAACSAYRPEQAIAAAPLDADWRPSGFAEHVFTHFALRLDVYVAKIGASRPAPAGMRWADLTAEAFPTVFRKVLEAAHEAPG